jgi:hypothetical protein
MSMGVPVLICTTCYYYKESYKVEAFYTKVCFHLKGQCHEIFDPRFFAPINPP